MFKLSIKRFHFLVKCCLLFISVLTGLSLFEFWRSGERDPLEEEYERQVLEDEARVVPGLGARGEGALLSGDGERLGDESFNKHDINIYVSDRISYTRTLPDFGQTGICRREVYDAELPSASVVIVFHNEPYSVLLRTVWNVLNTARRDQPWHGNANFVDHKNNRTTKIGYPGQEEGSEHVYLKEVILVDDNSTLPELRGKLAHYVRTRLPRGLVRLLRLPERGGLTRARQAGARAARGDVLLVLDARCEGLHDWIRPLLQRVKDKRTAVVFPFFDIIDARTFEYSDPGGLYVGGFTFTGSYTWIMAPLQRQPLTTSLKSPTMSGALFAMSRAYYWQLGGYDEQMAGWGGENLEMSFRVWQCGGSLELVPCSNVGHVSRSPRAYWLQADAQGPNMARVAEVWMDEYAELFYLLRPDLKVLHLWGSSPRVGDVSARKALRTKLRCKSFQWFLDTVFPEKFVPVRDALLYGRLQNPVTELCVDTLEHMERSTLRIRLRINLCRALLTDGQYFSLSYAGQLRDEETCAKVNSPVTTEGHAPLELAVWMVTCDASDSMQQWEYLRASQQLRHERSGLCLDAGDVVHGYDFACARDCTNHSSMRWTFDYGGSERSSALEERLRNLRGERGGSGGRGGGAASRAEGAAGARGDAPVNAEDD